MTWLVWLFATLAILLLMVSALGILRLKDALARQHAVTKAATLALSLLIIAIGIHAWQQGWSWTWHTKLLLLLWILLTTLPLASHALARSGVKEQSRHPKESA